METLRLSPNTGVGKLFTRTTTFESILKPRAALIGRAKKNIRKPETVGDFCLENLAKISVTGIASFHLKSKFERFAEQKSSGRKSNDSFRTDRLCLLALACYTFMDEPNSLKPILYKQETVCHSR